MTQHERIMNVLTPNEWIPLPKILATGVAQYNARIKELREQGKCIENKTEWIDGVRHSWFRRVVKEKQMVLI